MLHAKIEDKTSEIPQSVESPSSSVTESEQHKSVSDFDTFARLFRYSKFVQLGDFKGRIVIGTIVQRTEGHLYIDFGLKFNTVCRVPPANNMRYTIGKKVVLRLHDPELSERFLGAKKDLTLLEADATLLGLYEGKQTLEDRIASCSG
ncbi:unnamed protein product [Enterobius vermicularis]|uniref:S1 motif domain-containing protein n=1 Tax=Enterobius vermicularis TaxID=51028 RepID=A0A0N4UYU9_ENTVE|nr:unnamed protein product [Enterobius vermicularis]